MLLIGLTGGIGSGKTAVSDAFAALGVPIIDTDIIARELVQPGQSALNAIVDHFGPDCLTDQGQLDRAYLRRRVFAAPEDKKALETILHPRIRAAAVQRIERLSESYCILVIPLLIETRNASSAYAVDRVLVVDVPETTQIERVMARDQVDREQALRIVQSQASRQQRLVKADDVIQNVGSLTQLRQNIGALHRYYLTLAANTNC